MSITIADRPGRWVKACPDDPSTFTYCDVVGMGDFAPIEWVTDPNNNNELLWIYIPTNGNGLISAVNTHPDGSLYDPSGSLIDTVSWNAGQGAYYPQALSGPNYIFGTWTVDIQGISVTLNTGDTCTVNFWQQYTGPVLEAWQFTHVRTTGDMTVTFSQNGGVGVIDWGDGSTPQYFDHSVALTAKNYTYAAQGTYIVRVNCTAGDVLDIRFNSQDVTAVDIDGLTALRGLSANSNSLTAVANPTSAGNFTIYSLQSNSLTGTFNVSTLSNLGGAFALSANSGLTTFTGGSSTKTFSQFDIDSCGLTGTLDISGYTGLAALVRFQNNAGLTGITWPASSGTITTIWFDVCDMGYTDMTNLTISSAVDMRMQNNSMTAAEVNHILVDLDATLPGTGTGTLNIAGSNAAPDGSSGGYDGLTAKANLIAAGYSVTTN